MDSECDQIKCLINFHQSPIYRFDPRATQNQNKLREEKKSVNIDCVSVWFDSLASTEHYHCDRTNI